MILEIMKICFLVHYEYFNILLFLRAQENENMAETHEGKQWRYQEFLFVYVCHETKINLTVMTDFLIHGYIFLQER